MYVKLGHCDLTRCTFIPLVKLGHHDLLKHSTGPTVTTVVKGGGSGPLYLISEVNELNNDPLRNPHHCNKIMLCSELSR